MPGARQPPAAASAKWARGGGKQRDPIDQPMKPGILDRISSNRPTWLGGNEEVEAEVLAEAKADLAEAEALRDSGAVPDVVANWLVEEAKEAVAEGREVSNVAERVLEQEADKVEAPHHTGSHPLSSQHLGGTVASQAQHWQEQPESHVEAPSLGHSAPEAVHCIAGRNAEVTQDPIDTRLKVEVEAHKGKGTLSLDLGKNAPGKDVKVRLQAMTGVPATHQTLYWKEDELKDGLPLWDQGVDDSRPVVAVFGQTVRFDGLYRLDRKTYSRVLRFSNDGDEEGTVLSALVPLPIDVPSVLGWLNAERLGVRQGKYKLDEFGNLCFTIRHDDIEFDYRGYVKTPGALQLQMKCATYDLEKTSQFTFVA